MATVWWSRAKAFQRTGDPDSGDFQDGVVLASVGAVDLSASQGCERTVSDRWRHWRLYDPSQPVWLTALEAATTSCCVTITILMWVERLPADVYTNAGGTILCIGWLASAIVHRRRAMMFFSGALIVISLLGVGAHVFFPNWPRTATMSGHDVTPGPLHER